MNARLAVAALFLWLVGCGARDEERNKMPSSLVRESLPEIPDGCTVRKMPIGSRGLLNLGSVLVDVDRRVWVDGDALLVGRDLKDLEHDHIMIERVSEDYYSGELVGEPVEKWTLSPKPNGERWIRLSYFSFVDFSKPKR